MSRSTASRPDLAPLVDVCHGLTPRWPALAAGGPLLTSPGWLRAMTGRLGDRPVTIVVSRGGSATLAAFGSVQTVPRPGQFFDLHHLLVDRAPALPFTERTRARRAAVQADAPAPASWLPSLVVMLPGYECLPVGPDVDHRPSVDALVDGAVSWADAQDMATVAFLYTRPQASTLTAALAERGFVPVPLSLTWRLELPGDGMADYFAALRKKRRVEAQRELRLLDEAGVRLAPAGAGELAEVTDDLVRLRCQLVAKYRGNPDPTAERVRLRRIVDDVAGGRPRLVLARASDGHLLGFALFAEHHACWHCLAVGYDYRDERSRLTYFGTAYYGAAEYAYACGVRALDYGQGSWQAKRARGSRGTPLTGWVRTTDPALAAAVRTSAAITELATPGPTPGAM